MQLKTRIQMVEAELNRKEKVIDDLLIQQEQNFGLPQKFTTASGRLGGLKTETHLVINLKRKVRTLNMEQAKKMEEIEALKRNIRSTRHQEIETEIKVYLDECSRLRH